MLCKSVQKIEIQAIDLLLATIWGELRFGNVTPAQMCFYLLPFPTLLKKMFYNYLIFSMVALSLCIFLKYFVSRHKTSFVNIDMERRLFALLDRYKLAGKSYGYENAEILYDCRWTAYLCEKIKSNVITITYYHYKNPADGGIYKMSISSQLPVMSDLKIDITFIYTLEEAGDITVPFELKAGESYYEIATWDFSGHKNESISPVSDEFFDYVLKTVDVYE